MDTSSDDYMEVDEEEEIDIDHFNLKWQTLHTLKNRLMLGVLPWGTTCDITIQPHTTKVSA
ncbi:hypothetical protein RMCBS344292_18043 [Rhizopus microsporus]|nr:hypothetical protein RMCBS344292_18043 [Rhizopus microsporus]